MPKEKQVVSLELAKKLKELGVKQESLFYWNLWQGQMDDFMYQIHYGKPTLRGDGVLPENTYSAFTVAELGEMLPEEYPGDSDSTLVIMKFWSGQGKCTWYVRYQNDVQESVNHNEAADTEADARAKMLVYLLENKLITL